MRITFCLLNAHRPLGHVGLFPLAVVELEEDVCGAAVDFLLGGEAIG